MSLLNLEPCTVHAYAITDGTHLYRLPYSAAQWQESRSVSDPLGGDP